MGVVQQAKLGMRMQTSSKKGVKVLESLIGMMMADCDLRYVLVHSECLDRGWRRIMQSEEQVRGS